MAIMNYHDTIEIEFNIQYTANRKKIYDFDIFIIHVILIDSDVIIL